MVDLRPKSRVLGLQTHFLPHMREYTRLVRVSAPRHASIQRVGKERDARIEQTTRITTPRRDADGCDAMSRSRTESSYSP
jgi:hypothetical protein